MVLFQRMFYKHMNSRKVLLHHCFVICFDMQVECTSLFTVIVTNDRPDIFRLYFLFFYMINSQSFSCYINGDAGM